MSNIWTDLGFDMAPANTVGPAPIPLLTSDVAGTTTNDSAAAGRIGEYLETRMNTVAATGTAVTVVAATDLFTATAHGLAALQAVEFTTATTLPAGLSTTTNYYVTSGSVTANTFKVSDTLAHAQAGTVLDITDTGTGAHVVHGACILASTTAADVCGLALTAGDWDVDCTVFPGYGSSTSVTSWVMWLAQVGASAAPTTAALAMSQAMVAAPVATANTANTITTCHMPTLRISLSAAGYMALAAQCTFSVSTLKPQALLRARRVR